MEGGANAEAVTGLKVPRLKRAGLVMGEYFTSKGSKCGGIVATGAVGLLPGRYGRIHFSLAE